MIFVFDNMELLDLAGPYEVFSVANVLSDQPVLQLRTVAADTKRIRTHNGLVIEADEILAEVDSRQVIVLPGGEGIHQVLNNNEVMKSLKELTDQSERAVSICSGARFLAHWGYLDHSAFTTHHTVAGDILKQAPGSVFVSDKRFVDNGKFLTAAGVTAGMDLALYLVEQWYGAALRREVMKYMELDSADNGE
jgi:transcriptional regulator GlxA family with amidase domain